MMIAMMMVMMISMNGLQVKCDVADAMEVIQSTLKISLKRSEQQKKREGKKGQQTWRQAQTDALPSAAAADDCTNNWLTLAGIFGFSPVSVQQPHLLHFLLSGTHSSANCGFFFFFSKTGRLPLVLIAPSVMGRFRWRAVLCSDVLPTKPNRLCVCVVSQPSLVVQQINYWKKGGRGEREGEKRRGEKRGESE